MTMTDERIKGAVAVYRNTRNGKRTAIMPCQYGGFWQYRLDYDGLFAWGATADLPDYIVKWLAEDTRSGLIVWEKTPDTAYHVWHLCFCGKCKGKVWTHSQGDWDSHLRYVANECVYTFPTAEAT
jgi:hypothetical protein